MTNRNRANRSFSCADAFEKIGHMIITDVEAFVLFGKLSLHEFWRLGLKMTPPEKQGPFGADKFTARRQTASATHLHIARINPTHVHIVSRVKNSIRRKGARAFNAFGARLVGA